MDEVIFEEFKGTGNSEIVLDRKIADKRVFPAIDILKSGTRKEELLVDKVDLTKMFVLRRILNPMGTTDAIEFLLGKLKQTKTNLEFFEFDEQLVRLYFRIGRSMADTIFAQATAPGRAGVAVVRLSGPRALRGGRGARPGRIGAPRAAALRWLRDPASGERDRPGAGARLSPDRRASPARTWSSCTCTAARRSVRGGAGRARARCRGCGRPSPGSSPGGR